MKTTIIAAVIALATALPAAAQIAPPAGPDANPAVNAAIAHHDRVVARRAARHGHYRKAAVAAHAANAAATDAAIGPR